MNLKYSLLGLIFLFQFAALRAQQTETESFALEQCVTYALENQPMLKQSKVAEEISSKEVGIRLSSWLPQVSADATLQNNLQRPTSVLQIGDQPLQTLVTGTEYSSTIGLSVNQVIFSNDVMLAGKTASEYNLLAAQNTESAKIEVIVSVSKAYYQLLITQQQISVLDQTIERLEKNFKDAKNRYEVGISDKIDYSRAQIALNNTRAQRKATVENFKGQKALLKQLMGYPQEKDLTVRDNIEAVETEVILDTATAINFSDRIEYQSLQTEKKLSEASVGYYKQGYIPSLSAFYTYNLAYLNNDFSDLYNQNFPNSAIGLRMSLPIFQGMRRIRNIQKSKLQYEQLELREENLESQINTEYIKALGLYKSNLEQLQASRDNYEIAEDVYNTVKLQYDEGIKAYLEVIVAESDLRTSQLTYLNALLNVLSSKLDVQKAAGTITIPN